MSTYAQNEEDLKVLNYFKNIGLEGGVLVDIGANDGVTFSNSKLLIENGWKAHLVEPSHDAYARLVKLHTENPRVNAYNCAITETDGKFTLNHSGALFGTDTSLVSTLISDEMKRWDRLKMKWHKQACRGLTWETFIKKSKLKDIDFITIDCEGLDFQVLSQIDLNYHNVKCVCVEFNGKDKSKFVNYCKGFTLIEENAENLIFVR
jgi:FkbM family methyltransferase